MSEIELKPCPFCGSQPTFQGGDGSVMLLCDNLGCTVNPQTGVVQTHCYAERAWNDRAAEATGLREENERLCTALEAIANHEEAGRSKSWTQEYWEVKKIAKAALKERKKKIITLIRGQ